jgi:pimeloyl-ACP methyl ester carboxylesterase
LTPARTKAELAASGAWADKPRDRAERKVTAYTDGYWGSNDGLRLHYRDYPGDDPARPPILCIPGLTRNARDFEGLAERLAGEWRLISVDLRGRGESAHAKDPMTYVPLTYVQDLEALLRELAIERFVLAGTSMGGLLAMLLGAAEANRVDGLIVNDVGPDLDETGLARIRATVGRSSTWPTWVHAARDFAELHRGSFPGWGLEEWLVFAKRMARIGSAGRIVPDYDMRIAEPFKLGSPIAGLDLWAAWRGLSGTPALIVRGETSDILSAATLDRMLADNPAAEAVTIRGIGHAPTLDEADAKAAIDRLLARVGERAALA